MVDLSKVSQKIMEQVDAIKQMSGNSRKIDTPAEYESLSKLLAGEAGAGNKEYIQGFMIEYENKYPTLEKLEAMTCVCSVGLDMIAVPGDTKATTISGIIADEMAIGMINQKTTAVRLIPVIGKGVGETVEFGGLLGYAPVMPVNQFSCDAFVNRGGRIPAPIHSFKN